MMDSAVDEGPREGEVFMPDVTRTDRLMRIGINWFFLARESELPVGPFGNAVYADAALKLYLEKARAEDPGVLTDYLVSLGM